MTRKDFFKRAGFGAALFLVPTCIGGMMAGCSTDGVPIAAPTNIDFTVDISTGALSSNGGYITKNGIVIARTNQGDFLAVSAACTHDGTYVKYASGSNSFHCFDHDANFSSTGQHLNGPGSGNLTKYNTELNGNTLRIFI